MSNSSSNINLKSVALSFTITTLILTFLTILFDIFLIFRLIYFYKFKTHSTKSSIRYIGLIYSINTYIHILGQTIVFFLMATRTFYGDIFLENNHENFSPSWHCYLLNYLMSMFASGIYGSCFLQSLFRYWRVMKASKRRYRKYSFHFQFIFIHWILILILSIPVWLRSVYISRENFCLNDFADTYASAYISIVSVGIPIAGIVFVYLKIVLFIRHHWQSRKRWRRMKRDILIIKRIIVLVFVLLIVSTGAIILWLLMFIQQRLHPLSYRLLCFLTAINMSICSVTLLIVTPQLKRAFLFWNPIENQSHTAEYQTDSSVNKD